MTDNSLPTLKAVPAHIPEELIPVYEWWQDKGPKHVTIAAVILGIVAVIVGINAYRQHQVQAANIALAQAQVTDDYQILVDSNASQPAKLAQLLLARSYYDSAAYEDALSVYEAYLAKPVAPEFDDIAKLGRAHCLEALGRTDEAMTAVKDFIAANDKSNYLYATAVIAQARLTALAGDKTAAIEILKPYTDAAEGTPEATYKMLAEQTVKVIKSYSPRSIFEKAATAQTASVAPAVTAPATPVAPAAPAAEVPTAPAQ